MIKISDIQYSVRRVILESSTGKAVPETNQKDILIPLSKASEITGYNQDYLGFLVRTKKLSGQKIGRNWATTIGAIEKLLGAPVQADSFSIGSTAQKVRIRVVRPADRDVLRGKLGNLKLKVLASIQSRVSEQHVSSTDEREEQKAAPHLEKPSYVVFENALPAIDLAWDTLSSQVRRDFSLSADGVTRLNIQKLHSSFKRTSPLRGYVKIFAATAASVAVVAGGILFGAASMNSTRNIERPTSAEGVTVNVGTSVGTDSEIRSASSARTSTDFGSTAPVNQLVPSENSASVSQGGRGAAGTQVQQNAGAGDIRYFTVSYPVSATYVMDSSSVSTTANLYAGMITDDAVARASDHVPVDSNSVANNLANIVASGNLPIDIPSAAGIPEVHTASSSVSGNGGDLQPSPVYPLPAENPCAGSATQSIQSAGGGIAVQPQLSVVGSTCDEQVSVLLNGGRQGSIDLSFNTSAILHVAHSTAIQEAQPMSAEFTGATVTEPASDSAVRSNGKQARADARRVPAPGLVQFPVHQRGRTYNLVC